MQAYLLLEDSLYFYLAREKRDPGSVIKTYHSSVLMKWLLQWRVNAYTRFSNMITVKAHR